MDSTYLSSWLRQAQNASLLRAPNNEYSASVEMPQWPNSSQAQQNMTSPQQTSDEPLDLRVKPEPVDDTAPLDLTVNRSHSSGMVEGGGYVTERTSAYRSSRINYPNTAPTLFTSNQPSSTAYSSHLAASNFTPSASKFAPHVGDRKLHCTYCGYQSQLHQKDIFECHLATHSPHSQYYSCIHCQKSFADRSTLQEHLMLHGLLYSYICSMCSIAFSKQSSYLTHISEVHNEVYTAGQDKVAAAQVKPEDSLLKIGNVLSSSERSHCVTATLSNDNRSSPMSSNTASTSVSSPLRSTSATSVTSEHQTFGQSLAKEIEAAISQQVASGKTPSFSDLMLMKSEEDGAEQPVHKPNDGASISTPTHNPLNLMSLLDKVVEESIRAGPAGKPKSKPDLKFIVTFSDEEDEGAKECDSTVSNYSGKPDVVSQRSADPSALLDNAENVITSTERPVESPSATSTSEAATKSEGE